MRRETKGQGGRIGAWLGLIAAALALAGCGSTSDFFKTSPLDLFSSSSKATSGTKDTSEAAAVDTDTTCPGVQVRTGAATLMIGSKPGEGEPSALDLRYQGSIVRTARECRVNAGIMTMKVGIEVRVITGPAGGPGDINVPLRLAVVQEAVNPKTIFSKLAIVPVTITGTTDRVTFTHIDPNVSFPLPKPLGLIDNYVVYVGFDVSGAQMEKKKPRARSRPVAKKKKSAAKPKG
jgi:hypothetical protein